jgi:hypothetical protein
LRSAGRKTAYVQFVTILYHLSWPTITCTNVQVGYRESV